MDNVKAVILAAGESTRMKSDLTKLLHRLGKKALVEFPAGACRECGIKDVIVVVGYQADKVISVLGCLKTLLPITKSQNLQQLF